MGALSYVLSKYVIEDIAPISLLFYRWLVALIILTPFALKVFISEFAHVRANLGILCIIAISGVALFNLFAYYAILYTSSTNTSIIISIFPIFVLAFGVLINKDKLHKVQICSILLSFAGALVIVSHGHILQDLSSLFHNIGDFISLVAALCWAVYVFAVKFKPNNLSLLSFIYSANLIGTLLIFPLYLLDIFYLGHLFEPTLRNISVIICLGFGVSVIGILCINFSIMHIGPNATSLLYYLAPVFTSLMAIMFLGEEFELFHLVGMLSILFGVNLPLIMRFVLSVCHPRGYGDSENN